MRFVEMSFSAAVYWSLQIDSLEALGFILFKRIEHDIADIDGSGFWIAGIYVGVFAVFFENSQLRFDPVIAIFGISILVAAERPRQTILHLFICEPPIGVPGLEEAILRIAEDTVGTSTRIDDMFPGFVFD